MKKIWTLGIALAVIFLALGGQGLTHAQSPQPATPQTPPVLPQDFTPPATTDLPLQSLAALNLPPLKAVLIVGDIDGGQWTKDEIANMEKAAVVLQANGVTVYKFYAPNTDWNQIVAAANGAQFILYRGHGIYWSDYPNPNVGGFGLSNGIIISNDKIRAELKPAKNFVFMIYSCFSAGSSSGDKSSISLAEAQRRVIQYAQPFFDIGASAYYADWFGDAFEKYLTALFAGQTHQQAYEGFYDYDATRMNRSTFTPYPGYAMWLGWDEWYDPKPQYNNAFIGNPTQTLRDLFASEMTLSTNQVTNLALPSSPDANIPVKVSGTGSVGFTWSASLTAGGGSWLSFTPSGNKDGSMVITLNPGSGTAPQSANPYTADITITANDPSLTNRVQTIHVTMKVASVLYAVNLPMLVR